MKIERISDNQIRCTLNRADLEERQLNLRELAYGTDKARMLFREMMQRAMEELGFSPDNMPLVIEAVPLRGEGIMLIITRVEDPEELDTRFSKFSPSVMEGSDSLRMLDRGRGRVSAEDVLKTIGNILGVNGESGEGRSEGATGSADTDSSDDCKDGGSKSARSYREHMMREFDINRAFRFYDVDALHAAARVLLPYFSGPSSLYRRDDPATYYLVVHKGDHTPEEFNKICNIITEYGAQVRHRYSSEGYYREHYETVFSGDAIQRMQ